MDRTGRKLVVRYLLPSKLSVESDLNRGFCVWAFGYLKTKRLENLVHCFQASVIAFVVEVWNRHYCLSLSISISIANRDAGFDRAR